MAETAPATRPRVHRASGQVLLVTSHSQGYSSQRVVGLFVDDGTLALTLIFVLAAVGAIAHYGAIETRLRWRCSSLDLSRRSWST
jgi:hypothetical protein